MWEGGGGGGGGGADKDDIYKSVDILPPCMH